MFPITPLSPIVTWKIEITETIMIIPKTPSIPTTWSG